MSENISAFKGNLAKMDENAKKRFTEGVPVGRLEATLAADLRRVISTKLDDLRNDSLKCLSPSYLSKSAFSEGFGAENHPFTVNSALPPTASG